MANYCVECGKKVKNFPSFGLVHLCKVCNEERIRLNKKEAKEEKLRAKKVKGIILKEYKINSKIRELEKILGKPCTIELNVANEGTFLFGRFVRRKFNVKSISKNKKIATLSGQYDNIDDFNGKAKKIGFKVVAWDGTNITLRDGKRKYSFITDGIHEDIGRASAFARICGKKVADVKYNLWYR